MGPFKHKVHQATWSWSCIFQIFSDTFTIFQHLSMAPGRLLGLLRLLGVWIRDTFERSMMASRCASLHTQLATELPDTTRGYNKSPGRVHRCLYYAGCLGRSSGMSGESMKDTVFFFIAVRSAARCWQPIQSKLHRPQSSIWCFKDRLHLIMSKLA